MLKPKRLNQIGVHHILFPAVVFVLLFGIAGSYFYLLGHAATSNNLLQLGSDSALCMDNYGNSSAQRVPIKTWSCNKSDSAQQFVLTSVGSNRFLLKDAKGTCVDDTGDRVGTSGNQVYVMTYRCNSSDHAQVWMWSGSGGYHELKNAYNNGCINDPGSSRAPGTQLIVYSCSPNSSNEHWYEVAAQTSTTSPSPTPSPTPTPTPAPTPSPTSTTAPAIPATAPTGFTRAFTEDFNTPAALGSFDSVYGSQFGEYTGCCSTNKITQYSSSKVLYVQNGSLYYKLHSENSVSYAAAPQPWNEKSFLYGQVGMSVRLDSSNGPGYKIAFLLWPSTNKWSNEVDFPEVDPDFTAPVRAASLNYSPNGTGENGFSSQDNLSTGVYLTDNKYHTFLLTWTPGKIVATIDGKTVATFTGNAVPAQAMRLSLQAEGWINQGSIPSSTTDVLEVPWVYINTHN
jgi:hypothetical protein